MKIKNKHFKRSQTIYVILENIQYANNVASIFRTCDAAGVARIYLTGISQKPPFGKDLKKTSRNTEDSVEWFYKESTGDIIESLKKSNFSIICFTENSEDKYNTYDIHKEIEGLKDVCLIFGNENYGIKKSTLDKADFKVFVPVFTKGGTLNVSSQVAVGLYSF